MKTNKFTPEKIEKQKSAGCLSGEAAAFLGIHDFCVSVPLDRFCLARGYWEKGDKEQSLKWHREAITSIGARTHQG